MIRYQYLSWYAKLWRRRWQLLVPYWWLWTRLHPGNRGQRSATLWSLCLGVADHKMDWTFDYEDCFGGSQEAP